MALDAKTYEAIGQLAVGTAVFFGVAYVLRLLDRRESPDERRVRLEKSDRAMRSAKENWNSFLGRNKRP
jgi:hypothetical protein